MQSTARRSPSALYFRAFFAGDPGGKNIIALDDQESYGFIFLEDGVEIGRAAWVQKMHSCWLSVTPIAGPHEEALVRLERFCRHQYGGREGEHHHRWRLKNSSSK